MEATQYVCKDHDFESSDENDYSSEPFIPTDEEDEELVRVARSSFSDDEGSASSEDNEVEHENLSGNVEVANYDRSTSENMQDGVAQMQSYFGSNQRKRGGKSARHSGKHGYSGKKHQSNSNMVRVNMPTGRKVWIEKPKALKNWKCGTPTQLIELKPDGKRGKREFDLVAKVTELTKREHSSGHFSKYNFVKIEKVVNGCFWKKYRKRQMEIHGEAKYVNERMLFHGSNKVKELLDNGFDERYANIKGMFGAGIYFAKHSSKSNQYAFGLNGPCPAHNDSNCFVCERKMILCRVTLGKEWLTKGAGNFAHAPPSHHSVVALARPGFLKYPEYIVYRGEQVYPEYVITYTLKP